MATFTEEFTRMRQDFDQAQTPEQPTAIPGKAAQESRKPRPAQQPLPAQTAELSAPPEDYRQFRNFQRFREAMRGLEQGPRRPG